MVDHSYTDPEIEAAQWQDGRENGSRVMVVWSKVRAPMALPLSRSGARLLIFAPKN
jgi:hypothetical protein